MIPGQAKCYSVRVHFDGGKAEGKDGLPMRKGARGGRSVLGVRVDGVRPCLEAGL